MRQPYRPPSPEKRCAYISPEGKQCAGYKLKSHPTCAVHTPEYLQRIKFTPGILKNSNGYKNGTKAAPLKPLRQKADLLDHLTIKHYEIFLAAETATAEENLSDLSRLSKNLVNVTLRYTKTLKKKPGP